MVITVWDADPFQYDDTINKLNFFVVTEAPANQWSHPVRQCGFNPESCLTLRYRIVCNAVAQVCSEPPYSGLTASNFRNFVLLTPVGEECTERFVGFEPAVHSMPPPP